MLFCNPVRSGLYRVEPKIGHVIPKRTVRTGPYVGVGVWIYDHRWDVDRQRRNIGDVIAPGGRAVCGGRTEPFGLIPAQRGGDRAGDCPRASILLEVLRSDKREVERSFEQRKAWLIEELGSLRLTHLEPILV